MNSDPGHAFSISISIFQLSPHRILRFSIIAYSFIKLAYYVIIELHIDDEQHSGRHVTLEASLVSNECCRFQNYVHL
jgi:hypothetical protein